MPTGIHGDVVMWRLLCCGPVAGLLLRCGSACCCGGAVSAGFRELRVDRNSALTRWKHEKQGAKMRG